MVKSVAKFIFLVFADLFMGIVNYLLAPIIVLFAEQREDGTWWLPTWLWWFQTPDNPLDGDPGYKELHRPFKAEKNAFERWVNHFFWLYRNGCYGFGESVLGCPIKEGFKFEIGGSPLVSNRPLYEGVVFRKITNPDGNVYWQYYLVKKWSDNYCLRINLGWKLWGDLVAGTRGQFVFSPNPFMGFSLS